MSYQAPRSPRRRPTPPYSTDQVRRLVGVSYRRVDYWIRTGLIVPSIREANGQGTRRRYSQADLDHVRVVKALLDMGISLQRIRRYQHRLRVLVLDLADRSAELLELVAEKAQAS